MRWKSGFTDDRYESRREPAALPWTGVVSQLKFAFSRAICGALLLELPNVGHERVDFRFG
jgi:hypothetical protein